MQILPVKSLSKENWFFSGVCAV